VHQVGHYPELHQDARSTKHKKSFSSVYRFSLSAFFTNAPLHTSYFISLPSVLCNLSNEAMSFSKALKTSTASRPINVKI
jgi:S-adenosylmethionine:diacylglycerol 3-amino-3-carboxypropyl transferase